MTPHEKAQLLRSQFSQADLRAQFHERMLLELDQYSYDDPEWEEIAKTLDPIWFALKPKNRS